MAQIVINIPDFLYKQILKKHVSKATIARAFQNGVVLPKGHGRLIDADAFIKTMEDASKRQKYRELLIDNCLTVDDVFKAVIESLQNEGPANGDSPTIIEADKINKK